MNTYSSIKCIFLVLLVIVLPIAGFAQCGMTWTMVSQNVECNGDCDGSAAINGFVTGGTSPYTYLWNDPSGNTNFFLIGLCGSLAPGTTYIITVTDNTGCSQTDSVMITEPPVLIAALTSVDACFNQCNGQVILGASGGGDPSGTGSSYDYIFENASTSSTQTGNIDSLFTFSNLCPGTYNVTITDGLDCDTTGTIIVNEATDYTRSITSTDATCFNKCDGTATVNMGGSQPPYTYSWTPSGGNSNAATGLCGSQAGITYTVNITDSLGCTFDTSTIVFGPSKIIPTISILQQPSCPGVCDGILSISATGGDPGYSYNWSNGSSASINGGLCAWSYTVTITDQSACDTIKTEVLIDQTPMVVTATTELDNCESGSGTYIGTATVTGGDPSYSYLWSNGQTNSTAAGLLVNQTYTVTVTDNRGCQEQASVTVTMEPCPIEVPNVFSPNGDGINDTWDIKNLSLYPECEVKVHNRWGDIVFKQKGYGTLEKPAWKGTSLGLIPLPFGVYYYVIENVDISNFAAGYKNYGSVTIVK